MSTQTLSASGAPTGGSFQLRAHVGSGQSQVKEATIPWNATPTQIAALLRPLDVSAVGVAGTALPSAVTIRVDGGNHGAVRLSLGATGLTGGTTPAPAISEDTAARFDKPGRNDAGDVNTAGAFGPPSN